jgi:transposase
VGESYIFYLIAGLNKGIRLLLESGRKRMAPRKTTLYEVFRAVLYILKSGCQWRMPPEGFPKWQLVHDYWRLWSQSVEGSPGLLERALKKSGGVARKRLGHKRMPSLLIADAQSMKNANSAEWSGALEAFD